MQIGTQKRWHLLCDSFSALKECDDSRHRSVYSPFTMRYWTNDENTQSGDNIISFKIVENSGLNGRKPHIFLLFEVQV